ncbi:MAG: hypothetical protein ABR532_09020 [Candidatus Dormibacteria bacterium]
MVVSNIEVANGARTLAYLRQFLPIQVQSRSDSNCSCSAISGTFGSPYSDPASWYDSSHPESQFFYGLLLDSLVAPPVQTRAAKQRANGGQSLGQMVPKGQTLQASGAMYGASEMALEYGTRWLNAVLRPTRNSYCGLASACVLPACPDTGLSPRWRHLHRAGLLDGPTVAGISGIGDCLVRTVAFQIGSQSPYLFADPVTLASQHLAANTTVCGTASTTQWIGDATTRITITTGGPNWVTGLQVSGSPLRSNESCPSPSSPEVSFTVASLPPGTTLVIDGQTRTVEVRDAAGLVVGGLDMISTGGVPLSWIDIGQCARACVCVRATAVNTGTTVLIEQIDREL